MRNDWGCITCERKGVWRIRYWATTSAGYRRCSETIRGTRRQAGDRLAELRLQHGYDAPCPTLKACWTKWYLPDRERMVADGDMAPQTLEQYRSTWKRHVAPRWADVPCDAIRPLEVQQWLIELGRSVAIASMHLMRQVLDYATRFELIPTNPLKVRYLLPSPTTVKHRDGGIWAPDELGEVWRACYGKWFEPAMLLAGFGGCRVGEALGVRANDVQMTKERGVPIALVRIERQIDAHARESDRTKNRWSKRTALLAGVPATRLATLAQARGVEDGTEINDSPMHEDPEQCHTVIPSPYLTHLPSRSHATQQQLRRAFTEALKAQDVPVHLFKNLRSTWQTNARWVLRLPPWIVEPMMGHVGKTVTGRYYDKPSDQELAAAFAEAWKEHPFGDEYAWLHSC